MIEGNSFDFSNLSTVLPRRRFLRLGLILPAAGILASCASQAGTGLSSPTQPAAPTQSSGPTLAASPKPTTAAAASSSSSVAASAPAPPATAAVSATNAAAATCVLSPEQEEGPYYIGGEQIRSDVTEGRPGIPLLLRATFLDSGRCSPLPNAAIDIWHADAAGTYSGFSSPGAAAQAGQTFLRGTQMTDPSGLVQFKTIYPGWYPGRAIHIHVKVHLGGTAGASYSGGHVAHTGQMFFDEATSDHVMQAPPYSSHSGRRTLQSQDAVFTGQHGSGFVVQLAPLGAALTDGFSASITMSVDPNATPAAVGAGGGPGGRGGPGGPGGPPPNRPAS